MAQHRSGDYVYEKITDWPKMPKGQTMGVVSRDAFLILTGPSTIAVFGLPAYGLFVMP